MSQTILVEDSIVIRGTKHAGGVVICGRSNQKPHPQVNQAITLESPAGLVVTTTIGGVEMFAKAFHGPTELVGILLRGFEGDWNGLMRGWNATVHDDDGHQPV